MASLLVSRDPTPIAHLNPELPDQDKCVVRGEVTITWPYNSVTKKTAFLVAEPDVRLRRAKGQVRIELHGPSAKEFAACGIGAGDEVVFSLEGAEWAKDESPGRVPGARLDWQLQFNQRLALQAKLSESNEAKNINVDHPQEEPPVAPTVVEPPQTLEPETPVPQATPAVRKFTDYSLNEYPSPAFIKRARISYGSLFEGGLDIFEEDGGVPGKGRKRSRFGRDSSSWRYTSQSPSPEPETPVQDEMDPGTTMETAHLLSPKPQMADEVSQTVGLEVTPATPVPVTPAPVEAEVAAQPVGLHNTPPPQPGIEEQEHTVTPAATATAKDLAHSSPEPGTVEAAASSLFAISNPINTRFSMFGTASTIPVDRNLDIADQVRFGFSHVPQAPMAPTAQFEQTNLEHHAGPSPQPGPAAQVGHITPEYHVSPSAYPPPPAQVKFADMGTYVDAAEEETESAEGRGVSPEPPAVESFDRGGWEIHTQSPQYNGFEGGHFEGNALIDGTIVATNEPLLHSDEITRQVVPKGFDSYGAQEHSSAVIFADDGDDSSVDSSEHIRRPQNDLVENFETQGRSDDEIGAEDEDEGVEYDEYGDEIEEGDYDQRNYNAPDDDDEGLSNEFDEMEQETADRYGEEDVYDEEEGDYDQDEEDYGSEDDYEHQSFEGPVTAASSKEPVVISLLSDSEDDDDDEPSAPASKPISSLGPVQEEATSQEPLAKDAAKDGQANAQPVSDAAVEMVQHDDSADQSGEEDFPEEGEGVSSLEDEPIDEDDDESVVSSLEDELIDEDKYDDAPIGDEDEHEDDDALNGNECQTEGANGTTLSNGIAHATSSSQALDNITEETQVPGQLSSPVGDEKREPGDSLEKAAGSPSHSVSGVESGARGSEPQGLNLDDDAAADKLLEDEFVHMVDEKSDDGENEAETGVTGMVDEEEVPAKEETEMINVRHGLQKGEEELAREDQRFDATQEQPGKENIDADDGMEIVEVEDQAADARAEEVRYHPDSIEEDNAPSPMDVEEDAAPTPMEVEEERAPTPMEVEEDTAPTPMDAEEDTTPTPVQVSEDAAPTPIAEDAPLSPVANRETRESSAEVMREGEGVSQVPPEPTESAKSAIPEAGDQQPEHIKDTAMEDMPLPSPEASFSDPPLRTDIGSPELGETEQKVSESLSYEDAEETEMPSTTRVTVTEYFEQTRIGVVSVQVSETTNVVGQALPDDSAVGPTSPPLTQPVEIETVGEATSPQPSSTSSHLTSNKNDRPLPVLTPAESHLNTDVEFHPLRAQTPKMSKSGSVQAEITVSSPYSEDRGRKAEREQSHDSEADQPQTEAPSSPPDVSINLARQSVAARRSKRGAPASVEPLRTSPRVTRARSNSLNSPMMTRARSNSLQMSLTSEAGDEDPSISFARASLASPSKQHQIAEAAVPAPPLPTTASLKAELTRGLRKLSECISLKNLKSHVDKHLSIVAIVASKPTTPSRAKGGPREYMMAFNVTDSSIAPTHVVEVQLYRPHKESLPIVKPGDAVLLERFQVRSLSKKGFGLRTGSESAWAVYEMSDGAEEDREDGEEPPPQIKGPPVEDYLMYSPYMTTLKAWYRSLDGAARGKLEKAVHKFEEIGPGGSQK